MEMCFKHGKTFNTFTRVFRNVFTTYMNERVLYICWNTSFYRRRTHGSLYASWFRRTSTTREKTAEFLKNYWWRT